MQPLKVEEFKKTYSTTTKKISGFTEEQYEELEHMDYRDMKKQVLDELNARNNGIGKLWLENYGVLSMWTRENAVYVEIGNS